MKKVYGILRNAPFNRNERVRKTIHAEAQEQLTQLNQKYGELQGYAPDDVELTKAYWDAEVGFAAAEMALWEAIYRCSKPQLENTEVSGCNDEFFRRNYDFDRALALSQSANNNEDVHRKLRDADRKRDSEEFSQKLKAIARWNDVSYLGLVVSLVAYMIILEISVFPRSAQTASDLKIGSKGTEGATSAGEAGHN
jgi:hypothetical protein